MSFINVVSGVITITILVISCHNFFAGFSLCGVMVGA